jgi:hypothetical protein
VFAEMEWMHTVQKIVYTDPGIVGTYRKIMSMHDMETNLKMLIEHMVA